MDHRRGLGSMWLPVVVRLIPLPSHMYLTWPWLTSPMLSPTFNSASLLARTQAALSQDLQLVGDLGTLCCLNRMAERLCLPYLLRSKPTILRGSSADPHL